MPIADADLRDVWEQMERAKQQPYLWVDFGNGPQATGVRRIVPNLGPAETEIEVRAKRGRDYPKAPKAMERVRRVTRVVEPEEIPNGECRDPYCEPPDTIDSSNREEVG